MHCAAAQFGLHGLSSNPEFITRTVYGSAAPEEPGAKSCKVASKLQAFGILCRPCSQPGLLWTLHSAQKLPVPKNYSFPQEKPRRTGGTGDFLEIKKLVFSFYKAPVRPVRTSLNTSFR